MLFSAPMVRALLEGRKSQTRRIVKDADVRDVGAFSVAAYVTTRAVKERGRVVGHRDVTVTCHYGGPGDRLWGKETWQAWQRVSIEYDEWEPITREVRGGSSMAEWVETNGRPDRIEYRATSTSVGPWTPSIFMPRWASRLTLDVTAVRLERLQEITQADARAEGVVDTTGVWEAAGGRPLTDRDQAGPRGAYRALWESIHGPGSWEVNPWVWVISFPRASP
jgi:hypothetical protein